MSILSLSSPPPTPHPKKPDNIFKLKNTLEDLKLNLETPDKSGKLNKDVNTFISTAYSAWTHTTTELYRNEQKIKSIEAFDKRYNTFVTKCDKYVNAAKAIFDGLDGVIISTQKLIDTNFNDVLTKSFTEKLNKEILPITEAINKLKKEEPVAGSGGTPSLTDEQKETNTHLDALTTFLKDMVAELIATIKQNIEAEFSDAEIKKMIESDPDDFGNTIADKVNKICKNILQYVDKKNGEFMTLLTKNSAINTSDKIIGDISSITTPFDVIIAELKKLFAENGVDDTFYKVVDTFYFNEIQKLIKELDAKVVALGPVPEMADDLAVVSPGGGGGNGNASTFAAYPVSNKSHKNRIKGKGKGKGKSKNRKPNATKKNNRR